MNDNKIYFILYSNCIPVKGANRSVLYDLQLNRYRFIPNKLLNILLINSGKTIFETKKLYSEHLYSEINSFFEILIAESWGFYTSIPEHFPELDLTWNFPGRISNCIIDIDEMSEHDFDNIFLQLNLLGCEAIQLRFFCTKGIDYINNIISKLDSSSISVIEIIIPSIINTHKYEYDSLITQKRVRFVHVYAHNENIIFDKGDEGKGTIQFSTSNILSDSNCGMVCSNNFRVNIQLFTESINHNSCLNRKLSIDSSGNIKNCPSLKEIYGNTSNISLVKAVDYLEKDPKWYINKDQIKTCKDCEFRYMCTDCRAFIQNESDIYSKPLKCKYNPYTSEWEN